jgi:hypothetical protein
MTRFLVVDSSGVAAPGGQSIIKIITTVGVARISKEESLAASPI